MLYVIFPPTVAVLFYEKTDWGYSTAKLLCDAQAAPFLVLSDKFVTKSSNCYGYGTCFTIQLSLLIGKWRVYIINAIAIMVDARLWDVLIQVLPIYGQGTKLLGGEMSHD